MHLLPIALPILLLFQVPTAPPAPPAPDRVLATVNGAQIRAAEVAPYLWDWRAQEVVNDLIAFHLVRQAAERAGIVLDDAEVRREVEEQIREVAAGAPQGAEVEANLRAQGFPMSRIFLRVKTDLLLSQIAAREFDPASFVYVQTLVVHPKSEDAAEVAEAIRRAEEAYARLQKGEAWSAVLQSVTADPNLTREDGLLGWRQIEDFPAAARPQLQALTPGGVTKPVQTAHGIQIFRVAALGKTAEGEALEELREAFVQARRPRVLDRLQKEAQIERNIP
jgi:parvulin-like peptidyl-prolyl isomerase